MSSQPEASQSNSQQALTVSPSGPAQAPPAPSDFKVFKPPRYGAASPLQELPDSFFTHTAADVRAQQAALSARTNLMVNAPLALRSVRDKAEQKKRERWPNTTIRVKFTDRTQLEKTFPSTDKIRSVYAFVRGSLREDVKPIKFVLYQSPPKRDLKVSDPQVRDLTLAELQLAPQSILHIRFEDDSLNGSDYPAPLAPHVLDHAVDLPQSKEPETIVPHPLPKLGADASSESGSGSKGGEKKIPKWLKAGMKK